MIENKNKKLRKEVLIGNVYDGLPEKDEDVKAYFTDILAYEEDESPTTVKGMISEITSNVTRIVREVLTEYRLMTVVTNC